MLRSLARRLRTSATTVSLLVVAAGCARDPSALAAGDGGGGRGGGGGEGGSTAVTLPSGQGAGGAGGASGPSSGGASGTSQGSGGERPDEPEGPPRLVVVHGVPDRERAAFCFASAEGEGLDVAPVPPGGLAYATSEVAPEAAVPAEGDVTVVLVAGPAQALEEARCDALLGDPEAAPELERLPIGAVPRSAIDAPRVLVLAAAGCLGGEGHESDVAEAVCGVGYAPFSPTASLVVGTPSRLATEGRVGLQAIGASLPTAPFDVLVQRGKDPSVALAGALSLGATLPFPPFDALAAVDLAPRPLAAAASLPGEGVVLAEVDLGAAIERAGLEGLDDGETYALVFVGPAASLGEGAWWRGLDVAVVPTR